MQFNKSVVYQGKEKETTWGDFKYWDDIERQFDGKWAKIRFLSAFVELPYSFANLIGKKFVSQFELLYPKKKFRRNVLYRLYSNIEKSWMFISNLILAFSEFIPFKARFLSSLFSDLKVKFGFLLSCREDSKKFSLSITIVVNKDVWSSFGVWQDMYLVKNDTWGG